MVRIRGVLSGVYAGVIFIYIYINGARSEVMLSTFTKEAFHFGRAL